MNKRQFSAQEVHDIRDALGTGDLKMDMYGNIIDATTGVIIMPVQSHAEITVKEIEAAQSNRRKVLKEYFRNLEKPVKQALMSRALTYKIERASEHLDAHIDIKNDFNELWAISYEEMAKILAEGIILDDE